MRKFLAATVLATSALALGAGGQLQIAQAQEDARYGGTIRSIVVEGNKRIEARTVQSYLLLEPGDAILECGNSLFTDTARRFEDLKPKGILRWDVEVPAGTSADKPFFVEYTFTVEYDRQMSITEVPGK